VGLSSLSEEDWAMVDNHHLQRTFEFADFVSALDFVNRAGAICEEMNHHADFELSWGKVVVKTWTHSEGKVTQLDHDLAEALNQLE
tara:strand:+ start:264 stop:521 length:258 start_codon:yes stop_codon:yes gene_type:complete